MRQIVSPVKNAPQILSSLSQARLFCRKLVRRLLLGQPSRLQLFGNGHVFLAYRHSLWNHRTLEQHVVGIFLF